MPGKNAYNYEYDLLLLLKDLGHKCDQKISKNRHRLDVENKVSNEAVTKVVEIGLEIQKASDECEMYANKLNIEKALSEQECQDLLFKLGQKNKIYKWDKNKGYGTKMHRKNLLKEGTTTLHRKSFLSKLKIN